MAMYGDYWVPMGCMEVAKRNEMEAQNQREREGIEEESDDKSK